MSSNISDTRNWYDADYLKKGFNAQRQYPSEELVRFFGRRLFPLNNEERKNIKVLETGCGTCANLWFVGCEGFAPFGLDLSSEAIELGKKKLAHWNTAAELKVASMTDIPYEDNTFDVLIDVFSSNCLNMADFEVFLKEVSRVLKKGGMFFLYTPTANSEAFTNHAPAVKIDDHTLNGVFRKDSPFTGNHYPLRFSPVSWMLDKIKENGFEIGYTETITRTYNTMSENFQHVSIEAVKK